MLDLLYKRRSIRKFKNLRVEKEKIDEIIEGTLLAPSGRNKKPWHFVVITNKEIIKKLAESKSTGAQLVEDAPLVIVVFGDKEATTWIEETSITAEQVHNLYRLRWQIELLFKVMKSKLYMGELKDTSSNKSLLMMYGKMITLLTGIILFDHYDDVSLYKAIDYYKKKIVDVIDELCKESFVLFDKICRKIERFAKKSSRKKRPSANQICGLQPALNP